MFIKNRSLEPKTTVALISTVALSLVLSACSSTDEAAGPTTSASASTEVMTVHAAFYPLEFLATQIGGDKVLVKSLTAVGAEPHDTELTPAQVAELETTSLALFIDGFMPAVDQAIESMIPDRALNLAGAVTLLEAGEGHEDHGGSTDESHGAYDPHIWLDPANMIAMASAVSDRLISLDPANADFYAANAASLKVELETLDQAFTTGLASCQQKEIVTSHDAFGYLANAYGLTQHGIAGLSPDSEPSPARLAEISDMVKAEGITTIYYETLVSPAIAQTVANETGATTAVLDPIEGLTAGSTDTFITVMQANLQALIKGQICS